MKCPKALTLQSMLVGATAAWLFMVIAGVGLSNLGIPLIYSGDGLAYSHHIQRIIEDGWILNNERLGAPFGSAFYGYPIPDTLSLILLWVLAQVSGNYAVVLNLYIISCFALNAASAHLSARLLGAGAWMSALVGLLFAFTPFFFQRVPHLFFLLAPAIPLVVMLSIRFAMGRPARTRSIPGVVAICVIAGASGAYYAAFAAMLLLLALLMAWLPGLKRDRVVLMVAPFVVMVTFAGCLGLSLALQHSDEQAGEVHVAREYAGVEVYGLKFIQMVVPSPFHRSEKLAAVGQRYGSVAPLVNENSTASLGVIGSTGLFLSFLCIFLLRHVSRRQRVVSSLVVGMFAIGTIGGLGAVFAFFVTPELRALNRVSIVIQFLSLLTLAFSLEGAARRLPFKRPVMVLVPVSLAMLAFGLWDQTPKDFFKRQQVENEFNADRAFFEKVERESGDDAMVFIYPYLSFPEQPPLADEGPYGMMKGFLHTTHTKWSYGGMKYDLRMQALEQASGSLPGSLPRLRALGYTGLLVEMAALGPRGHQVVQALEARLGPASAAEDVPKRYFWSLRNVTAAVTAEPKMVILMGGYGGDTTPGGEAFTWLATHARIGIVRPKGVEDPVSCTAIARSLVPVSVEVHAVGSVAVPVDVGEAPTRLKFVSSDSSRLVELEIEVKPSTSMPIPNQGPKQLALMLFDPVCGPAASTEP